MAIQLYYGIFFGLALLNVVLVCFSGRMQNVYRLLLTVSALIGNVGYFSRSISTTLDSAQYAMKLIYVAGCFVPLFIFLLTTDICGLRLPSLFRLVLTLLSIAVLGFACTIGHSDIFYKNSELVIENGVPHLYREYGWAHGFVFFLIGLYTILCIGIVFYALSHQNIASYKTAAIVGVVIVGAFVVYAVERAFDLPVDILPVYLTLCSYIFFFLTNRLNMYDINGAMIGSTMNNEEYGCIILDRKKNFMSANPLAKKYFPDLANYNIDYPIRLKEEDKDDTRYEIISWLNSAKPGDPEVPKKYEVGGRVFRFRIKNLKFSGFQYGYLLEFTDITKDERYVDMIEHYNNDLQNEVKEQTAHISTIKDMLVVGMASMVDSRDNSTGGHIRRTADVVLIFAQRLLLEGEGSGYSFSKGFLNDVVKAAPMHDLGKIAVKDEVLTKKGKYTPAEYAEMKKHPAEGAKIVRSILTGVEDPAFVDIAENVAHYHHEKWNGEGYPEGLKREEIPVEARIMALADVFDALVSKRYYKDAYSYDVAFGIIQDSLGSHFDPELGKIFIRCRRDLEGLYDYYKDHGDDANETVERRRVFGSGLLEETERIA